MTEPVIRTTPRARIAIVSLPRRQSMQLSYTGAAWAALAVPSEQVESLRSARGLSEAAARCLALRWGGADLPAILSPAMEHLHDPHAMRGMGDAVDRLERATRDGERIRVVTDYDVDGTTSSLILQAALKLLARGDGGAAVDYHIPDRFAEGYGFSKTAAEAAVRDGIRLIVTADIGVRDHAAVQYARERGVDVMICDHHLPEGATVPSDAIVLCPPQTGCDYPNPYLAACGISLKLAEALLHAHPKRTEVIRSFLKLAAIGTVADLVPLTSLENRAIVSLGLAELNRGPHTPGLAALLATSALESGQIRETDLGFRIGPRINAAGRVADAKLVVRLLTCRDPQEAQALAREIERLNSQRKDIQHQLVQSALSAYGGSSDPFVVVAGPEAEGWHRGVVGIVASRLKDELHRPVAVVSIHGDRAVGSIRSVPSVHAVRALDSARELLEKYGGHPAAAGFTVPTSNLDRLRERLCTFVRDQTDSVAAHHVRDVDAFVAADSLTDELHHELEGLGPFGQGNPRPRLAIPGVRLQRVEVGNKGLLKAQLPRLGRSPVEAVWWDHAEHAPRLGTETVDLLGDLLVHRWGGNARLQFQLADVRTHEHAS